MSDAQILSGSLPVAPPLDVVLDLRGVRAYLAQDGENIVLVLQDDEGTAVSLEPGIGGSCPEAVDSAERIGRVGYEYAELLRTMTARGGQS